jgi:hypothetical protein
MAVAIPANIAALNVLVATNNALVNPLTIGQRYRDQMAFLCLLERIGCGEKERFRLLHDGFDTMQSLVDHYGDKIDNFRKQLTTNNKNWVSHRTTQLRSFFSPVVINRLVGTLYYFNTTVQLFHVIPDTQLVTGARASSYGNLFITATANDDEDADKITVPPFQDAKGWTSFRDNFILMLSLNKGIRGVPLDYVVDTTVRAAERANATRIEVDDVELDDDAVFKQRTVHFGNSFKQDNKVVWNKLHALLLDKPGYNHINSYANAKNGRAAWLALKTFYEGEDFQQRLRETAFLKLQTTFYRGETNRFDFEKYVNIHKSCHKMLEDANFNGGTGLDYESKITYFRNGIKSDAGLEIAMSNSRSNPRITTFESLISFFTAEVQHNSLRRKQLKAATNERKVSGVGKQRNSGGGGKRGKDKGNQKSQSLSEVVDGKKVEGRWYSKEEFGKLTPKQRTAVIKLKRQAKPGNDSASSNSNIAALRQEMQDDMVTLGEAIISGVSRASADNNVADDISATTGSSRQSAESGSIGNIFRNRNKRARTD